MRISPARLALPLAVLLLSGCASAAHPSTTVMAGQRQNPPAHPTAGPCRFPTSADLSSHSQEADLVVEASVTGPPTVFTGSSGAVQTRFDVEGVKVVGARDPSGAPTGQQLTIVETGGATVPLLLPGRYLLFLYRTALTGTYYVMGGMLGAIRERGTGTLINCPNYDAPSQRFEADSALSLQDVAALVPPVLPPRPIHHK